MAPWCGPAALRRLLPARTAPRCIWKGRWVVAGGWRARCRGRPEGCCSPIGPCCSCTPVCSCGAEGKAAVIVMTATTRELGILTEGSRADGTSTALGRGETSASVLGTPRSSARTGGVQEVVWSGDRGTSSSSVPQGQHVRPPLTESYTCLGWKRAARSRTISLTSHVPPLCHIPLHQCCCATVSCSNLCYKKVMVLLPFRADTEERVWLFSEQGIKWMT